MHVASRALLLGLLIAAVGGFAPPRTAVVGASLRAPRATTVQQSLVGSLHNVAARRGEIVVVKYGGHAMTNDERAAEFTLSAQPTVH